MASRLGAGAVLAAALAGGLVTTATSAGAATPQLNQTHCNATVLYTVSSTSIMGSIYTLCPLQSPSLIPDEVVIYKYVNGNAVAVASGLGTATYTCNGSKENQFSIADDVFNAACG